MSETWPTNADLRAEHNALLADHRETMLRVAGLRDDLKGARARLIEVDNQLQATVGELRALRAEHAGFKQHAAANLASLNELAAELTAEVAKDPGFTRLTVGVLRALTFNLGFQFRGETRPGGWDEDAEFHRLTWTTEVDQPADPGEPAAPKWHDDWEMTGRDGDGNAILRHRPTGGLYRVLPVEDLDSQPRQASRGHHGGTGGEGGWR